MDDLRNDRLVSQNSVPLKGVLAPMEAHAQQGRSDRLKSDEVKAQLEESGFALIPGPFPVDRMTHLVDAYDQTMESASGPNFRIGNATIRTSDLLNQSHAFDDIFLYSPLLQSCREVIGESFKLSSLLARTLRAGAPAQALHADLPRDSEDAPMVGFILMIDPFHKENGATRFVPGSHGWPDLPSDRLSSPRTPCPDEVLACGDAGIMILFNAAVWHGHTANITPHPRRSIQGYFVRRNAHSGFDFANRLLPPARARMSPLARHLLSLDEQAEPTR